MTVGPTKPATVHARWRQPVRSAGTPASQRRAFASLLAVACLATAVPAHAQDSEIKGRLKWFTAGAVLPPEDFQRQANGTPSYDHTGSLRVLVRADANRKNSDRESSLRFIADYSLSWLSGDSLALASSASQQTLDQTPTEDARRLMRLTWEIDDGRRHRAVHRFDRFALEYRRRNLSVTVGRQAVSWGSGRVFQPMDLFNPFAPTTVDRDYKPGDDIVLVEQAFGGSDLQFLYVARRDEYGKAGSDSASRAIKWHGFVGGSEIEVLGARHYLDDVLGLTVRVPIGGAILRTDVTGTRLDADEEWYLSGIVNIDWAFDLFGRAAFGFVEYYHNDFGVRELPGRRSELPSPLVTRLARGELFNLMRDYLAVGATYQWSALWTQSLTTIVNLDDRSSLVQTSLVYEPSDFTRMLLGITTVLGDEGEEFGGVPVVEGVTSGGGTQAFLQFVYFR